MLPWPMTPQAAKASVMVGRVPPRPEQAGPGLDPAPSGPTLRAPGAQSASVAERCHRGGRDVDRKFAHHFAGSVGRRAVDDDGDIGRGYADVEAQDPVLTGSTRHNTPTDEAG